MSRSTSSKQLLIRPGAIGDFIVSLPALEHLTQQAETELWAPTAVLPLVQFAGVRSLASTGLDSFGLDERSPDAALVDRLKAFDRIVSWYGSNRPEFREALTALQPSTIFHSALPRSGCTVHATDFYTRQVGAPDGSVPRIRLEYEKKRGTVVIHPFSGSKRKNWPLAAFEELADQLPVRVEWAAGPEEPLKRATRFDDLGDLARWLSGASLYIGNDSGITHLAAAIGLPVIALFVDSDPEVWAPRGNVTVLRNPTPIEAASTAVRRLCDRT